MSHPLPARAVVALFATTSLACAQWLQRAPATSPTARTASAMTFVPQNGGLVLFGGGDPFNDNETWTYDGVDWTQLTPAASPSPRFGMSLVYDSQRGVAVLYGGLATIISIPPPTAETWEWDGVTWTQVTPAANAGPRYRHGACYDPVRGRTVIYGGASTQLLVPPNAETWEYDGTTWSLIATTGNPGPLERPAMCYHEGIARAVMFGGSTNAGLSDQTWLYDGFTGTWTQVATTGPRPSPRNAATLVYDAEHGVSVLTGGQDQSGPLADTWTFDGVAWTQQPTTTQAVRDHVSAFLPTTSQVVKFGGFVAAPSTLTNGTWEIGGGIYGSGCAGSAGVPSLSAATPPQLGQPWTLDLSGLDPASNFAFFVLGLTSAPAVDLGVVGMPGCLGFVAPDLALGVSGAAGAASWTWPAAVGPIGASLYAQALCLDPTANTFGFTASNAVYATLTN